MQVHFGLQEYKSGVRPSSYQSAVNCYPERQEEGAKTQWVVRQAPGSVVFSEPGSGPIQVGGLHVMDGVLYAVSGKEVYKVKQDGSYDLLGSINDSAPVSMADNGTQLIIVNGTYLAYLFSGSTWALMTDEDYKPSSSVGFHNNYGVFIEDETGRFYHSSLNDFSSISALDVGTANTLPDNLITHLSDHEKLYLFGVDSIEIWYESGGSPLAFDKTAIPTIRRGIAGKNAKAFLGRSFAWVGDDKVVYRFDGSDGLRISTGGIEERLKSYAGVDDLFCWSYSSKGHEFFVMTKPGVETHVYDTQTTKWHKREYYNSGSPTRFRGNAYAYCYGKHLIGDFETGKIYEMRDDVYQDDGEHLVWQAVSNPISFQNRPFTIDELDLDFESGIGLPSGQGSDPLVHVEYSYNGGKFWDSAGNFPIGQLGQYDMETKITRLGQAEREAMFRLTISDPVKKNLLGATANVS